MQSDHGQQTGGQAIAERGSDEEADWPRVTRAASVVLWEQRGPLPSEQWLRAAEQEYPGVTKALVDDFIAYRKHVRALERRAMDFDEQSFAFFASHQMKRLWMAFALAFIVVVGGIALALAGHSLVGFAMVVGDLAVMLLAFLYGRAREADQPPQADDS